MAYRDRVRFKERDFFFQSVFLTKSTAMPQQLTDIGMTVGPLERGGHLVSGQQGICWYSMSSTLQTTTYFEKYRHSANLDELFKELFLTRKW